MGRPADPFEHMKHFFVRPRRSGTGYSSAPGLNLGFVADDKLLGNPEIRNCPGKYPAQPLPIDDEVRSWIANDRVSDEFRSTVYLQARRSVAHACAMADMYATYRLKTLPDKHAYAQRVVADADKLGRQIEDFGKENYEALVQLAMSRTIASDGRTERVRESLRLIQDAGKEFQKLAHLATCALADFDYARPAGSAGNVWHIGFIWQMGLAWTAMVKRARISSKSEGFLQFLQQGLVSVDESAAEIDWVGTVRTTVRRFKVSDGTWSTKLGEDTDPFTRVV
jgi:hypothetical protein